MKYKLIYLHYLHTTTPPRGWLGVDAGGGVAAVQWVEPRPGPGCDDKCDQQQTNSGRYGGWWLQCRTRNTVQTVPVYQHRKKLDTYYLHIQCNVLFYLFMILLPLTLSVTLLTFYKLHTVYNLHSYQLLCQASP